jgi:transcriptional regulator with XRE-family HTH domain
VKKNNKDLSLLQYAAKRAVRSRFFLAESLKEFRINRGMTEDDLGAFLGCSPVLLTKLALCRRPDPESPKFRNDIERIATAFNMQPIRLVQVIREVDSLKALTEAKPINEEAPEGLLAVARDIEDKEADDTKPEEPPEEEEDAKQNAS